MPIQNPLWILTGQYADEWDHSIGKSETVQSSTKIKVVINGLIETVVANLKI